MTYTIRVQTDGQLINSETVRSEFFAHNLFDVTVEEYQETPTGDEVTIDLLSGDDVLASTTIPRTL